MTLPHLSMFLYQPADSWVCSGPFVVVVNLAAHLAGFVLARVACTTIARPCVVDVLLLFVFVL